MSLCDSQKAVATIFIVGCGAITPVIAAPVPAAIFSDNVVLQQGVRVPVWGTAPAGDAVMVTFGGQTAMTVADAAGQWRTALKALAASTAPRDMTIADATGAAMVHNVLVGEVWLCSGQSNMELHAASVRNAGAAIQASDFPAIREFDIGRKTAAEPLTAFSGHWDIAGPATTGNFSAVAYFYARELWNRLHVPVGLINSSWGGTAAQPWTPLECFASVPLYKDRFNLFLQNEKDAAADPAGYKARINSEGAQLPGVTKAWFAAQVAGDIGQKAKWYDPATDTHQWHPIALPFPDAAASWNDIGTVWARFDATIPAAWTGKALTLRLGAMDDVDITYVNGREVGRTWQDVPNFWRIPRQYAVPADLVNSTKLSVVVCIPNVDGIGGMFGKPEQMSLAPADDATAAPISLAGRWLARRGSTIDIRTHPWLLDSPAPGVAGWDPAAIYNGMIAPLQPFAIRGAIWYQGESNANVPAMYAQLFPAMIAGWRHAWGEGDFPFYFVQLAGFQALQKQPIEFQSWADVRDAQMHALALPNTGMAVAADIGEAADIHPKDKQDVGLRLALVALHKTYGQANECSGPTLKSWRARGHRVVLKFDHAEGMHSLDNQLAGFAIAGADKIFHFATATIDGRTITVSSSDVANPVAVRYNWAFNPAGHLVNKAGLPASQFRTDDWGYWDVASGDR